VSHLLGLTHAQIGNAYGSQVVVAPGAELVTSLSTPLGIAALCVTYAIIVLRRKSIRPENVALPGVGNDVIPHLRRGGQRHERGERERDHGKREERRSEASRLKGRLARVGHVLLLTRLGLACQGA
jgi:hypothetical protein